LLSSDIRNGTSGDFFAIVKNQAFLETRFPATSLHPPIYSISGAPAVMFQQVIWAISSKPALIHRVQAPGNMLHGFIFRGNRAEKSNAWPS